MKTTKNIFAKEKIKETIADLDNFFPGWDDELRSRKEKIEYISQFLNEGGFEMFEPVHKKEEN